MTANETQVRNDISDLLRRLIPLINAFCEAHPTKRTDLLGTVGRLVALLKDGTTPVKRRTTTQDIPHAELDALFSKVDAPVSPPA